MKKSLYLDRSAAQEVQLLADRHHRSWASECTWLLQLGLSASSALPREPWPIDDRSSERRYIYPGDPLATRLDRLLVRLNKRRRRGKTPGSKWTFSAMVRALLMVGTEVEVQIARGLDAALARVESCDAGRVCAQQLATTLLLRHTPEELLQMQRTGPTDDIKATWGRVTMADWPDIVRVAIECADRLADLRA